MACRDTDPIEENLPAAIIDTDTSDSTRVRFENHRQAFAQVVEDNDSLTEEAEYIIADFLRHQKTNLYIRQAAQSVSTINVESAIDKNGLIIRVALIDCVVHISVPQALWERVLYHSGNLVNAGHSGQRRLYDSMRSEFLWPHMDKIVYTTVSSWSTYKRNGTFSKLKRELQQFSASGLLELVVAVTFKSLNHYVIVKINFELRQ